MSVHNALLTVSPGLGVGEVGVLALECVPYNLASYRIVLTHYGPLLLSIGNMTMNVTTY